MSASPASAEQRELPIRMRPDIVAQPMRFGGTNYWGIKDPVSLRYYKLQEEEFHILRLLDGRSSMEQIKERFERRFAPRRLELQQLQGFLGMLHREGLIIADNLGQGEQLDQRRRDLQRGEFRSSFSNLLAIRFRGIDPEAILNAIYPFCRWFFTLGGLLASFGLIVVALALVTVRFETLQARLPAFHGFFTVENMAWIALAVGLSKVLHEFGHGLACKHFGGECHELGMMLLVFTPCLYCNVSDSWMLPNRWHRAAIGAAGMYVEVVLAAVCTLLWWFSEPGLLNTMFLNLMFVCSASTLLFNGNPLLRYDGYYILSDILDVPNMRQQANAVVLRPLARWFFGIDLGGERMLPDRRRGWLIAFAVAATIYRLMVVGVILFFLHAVLKPYGLTALAQCLAVLTIVGMIVAPAWRVFSFVRDPRRSRQVKYVRFVIALIGLAGVATLIAIVPIPSFVTAPVVLEPQDARRVYIPVAGTLQEAVALGTTVEANGQLARLENPQIAREIARLEADRDRLRENRQGMEAVVLFGDATAASQIKVIEKTLEDIDSRLAELRRDRDRLTVLSPIAGTVLPPRPTVHHPRPGELKPWSGTPLDRRNRGCHLQTGTLLCLVGDPDRFEAVVVVDQADIQFVRVEQPVTMQFDLLPGEFLTGTIREIAELDLDIVPPELLPSKAVATVLDESGMARPVSTSYQARVEIDATEAALLLRATGRARIHVAPQSIGQRLVRYVKRTFHFEL